ncbi:pilus assembly protein PilB [bacterium SM23_31]|nr:MAG: pilus assembly protein PilB [bacterium SM23_31]
MELQLKNEPFGHRLGDRLIQKGIVPRSIIMQALEVQKSAPQAIRRKLGEILVQDFNIEQHLIYREIADMYAFREIDLSNGVLQDDIIRSIKRFYTILTPELQASIRKYAILPYESNSLKGNFIKIAAADPTHSEINIIATALGFVRFEIQYCRLETLEEIIERILPTPNAFLKDYENTEEQDSLECNTGEIDEVELDTEIHRSKLTNLIEGCFLEAVHRGASDIHFVPRTGNQVEIYFRIDGKLISWHTQKGTKAEAIAAVLKDRSKNVNRFERDSAQDGFYQREIDGAIIRFRVSILPIVGVEYERKMESIVVRILDDRKVITDLSELGFLEQAKRDFNEGINKAQGIVILTGPTGSGKSTTLLAALNNVMKPEFNVLTVEEPVEYLIYGARQLKINPKMDFDQAIRSILRHDPDIVMVGEMRDRITAEIAFKLANTGHLTLTTLHTNDAVSVISRLYKMGIEPFLIAHAVNIVVAQRLVRKLCQNCKTDDESIDPEAPLAIGFTNEEIQNITFYKPVGCRKCHQGFSGRMAIHEALLFTREIRKTILEMSEMIDEDRIKNIALQNGMMTLRASGRERIKAGDTTCAEVAFVTAEDK